ncbi:hypothetical protein B9479_006124 [Cryptococcus floricola]|uniref:LysM domain-containing protein n=1 Tax=Cryptococcus floricola TaxID=2591691 RepID=A0A5D3AU04_9TREE|nr:hypothetical protein B9479_006124 [Cryptococcus floricola]
MPATPSLLPTHPSSSASSGSTAAAYFPELGQSSDTAAWEAVLGSASPSVGGNEQTNGMVRRRTPGMASSSTLPSSSTAASSRSASKTSLLSTPPLLSSSPSASPSPSRTASSSPLPHPLSHATPNLPSTLIDTRPALHRATSKTERQVAESSNGGSEWSDWGSGRGSLDVLRMTMEEPEGGGGEVEVLIHGVKPHESLAGIALLYGIDLTTLRKANKLWATDPIHVRSHLYVPLDACRWNKASETLARGPGEGQVTLHPKRNKGKAKEEPNNSHVYPNGEVEEADESGHDPQKTPRVLDIVRMPSSQLQPFPRRRPPDPPSRSSQDLDRVIQNERDDSTEGIIRRASLTLGREQGPSIIPDLSTLPPPLRASSADPGKHKSKTMVRLRPPQATTPLQTSSTLANRLSSLFTIAPPPPHMAPLSSPGGGVSPITPLPGSGVSVRGGGGRSSVDSSASGRTATPLNDSRRGSSAEQAKGQREEMELVTRVREGVGLGLGMGALGGGQSFTGRKARSGNRNGKAREKND